MTEATSKAALDAIDHIAVAVSDVAAAVAWYTKMFNCSILYQDATWAFLKFNNISLALVIPEQHPSHIAMAVEDAKKYGQLKTHRDGTRSVYVSDPSGNAVELLDKQSIPADQVNSPKK